VGEQLIPVSEIAERHGFFAERMNDMSVVDDVAAFDVRDRAPPLERRHERRAEKAVEPVVIEPDAQAMADQAAV
jgi:hypothetical protein